MRKTRMQSIMLAAVLAASLTAGLPAAVSAGDSTEEAASSAAQHAADLIDAIYVQEWTEDTAAQCAEAKEAWDALSDEEKEFLFNASRKR